MRIAVTGASGLIGSALVGSLRQSGHEVLTLVRRESRAPGEVTWNPKDGTVDLAGLQGTEAVVHLAGAGVGDHRWTDAYKREILDSRVQGTTTIATAMARLDPLPQVLVSASAMGWYGDTGEVPVDESAPRGSGFLAEVVEAWETAADPARDAGIRVAHPRTGLVVSPGGGAFGPLIRLTKLGVGGRLGSGRQWWSFISLNDEVRALRFLIDSGISGPVNLTGPSPARNADVISTLGRLVSRPTILPVPGLALRVVLGEFSGEVLVSQRVLPRVLQRAEFTFENPDLESALRTALAPAA
jgi:uncharacterized protein (TIGR01777 family)